MPVTKEQVTEEAKRLGITVTDAQVAAYVTIGALPKKEDTAPPAGDDDGDDDADVKGDSKGVQERIKKINQQKKDALDAKAKAEAALKVLQDKEAASQAEKDKLAGNWEKLNKDALDAKAKAEATAAAAKDKFKATAIKSRLETELLKAGCPAERLSKAVKLFDASQIGFTWTNEDSLEFDIEDFGSQLEGFKKENDFLFTAGGEEAPPSGYQGNRPPASGGKTSKDREERIKSQFSSLR
jgi:hypothetical protein